MELVLDIYDETSGKLHLIAVYDALKLLQYDYIGGSGSRGYGKISFSGVGCMLHSLVPELTESTFSNEFNEFNKLTK
jgi:CRISPR-associated protein Csm3